MTEFLIFLLIRLRAGTYVLYKSTICSITFLDLHSCVGCFFFFSFPVNNAQFSTVLTNSGKLCIVHS